MSRSMRALAAVGALIILTPAWSVAGADAAAGRAPAAVALEDLPDPEEVELPPDAVPGSTPERTDAWDGGSTADRDEALAVFRDEILPQAAAAAAAEQARAGGQEMPSWQDVVAGRVEQDPTLPEPAFASGSPPGAAQTADAAGAISAASADDMDADGLPESFENQLADEFTPMYHVSAGEKPATGFATFNDGVPQQVQTVLPPTPPVSHFRVKPLGFGRAENNQLVGVMRIDYMTLWNRDDGLTISTVCNVLTLGLGNALRLLGKPHELDNERAAALVAAPVSSTSAFNMNPAAYKAYAYFTAAHEDEAIADHSLWVIPETPKPAGQHLRLAASRSKHATYPFNPNFMPIVGIQIVFPVYSAIIAIVPHRPILALRLLFIADVVFFACAVERFSDQGGQLAGTRINVGDPDHPINQSGFIRDEQSGIRGKFTKNVFPFFEPEAPPPPVPPPPPPNPAPPQPIVRAPDANDYDGDGRSDRMVWRPSNGEWWVVHATGGGGNQGSWGSTGDVPVPGDYDGDGRDDRMFWRPSTGEWWVAYSGSGGANLGPWGLPGDIPVPGDYDGDGRDDRMVWRPSTGEWWVVYATGGGGMVGYWGWAGDIPVPGDYDGDGRDDRMVWRPSNGEWWVVYATGGGGNQGSWGFPTDIAVPGDFDGDGRADRMIWRPSNGEWWVVHAVGGGGNQGSWGFPTDIPI